MPTAKPRVSLRKPPAPVSLEAAESFVSAGDAESLRYQTSRGLDVRTSNRSIGGVVREAKGKGTGKALPRGVLPRADGREVKRMTVYMPPDLAKRLAVYCAESDRDISDVVSEAVEKRLGS
jgi:hypothetical protein